MGLVGRSTSRLVVVTLFLPKGMLGTAEALWARRRKSAPTPAELRDRYGPYIGWWAYLCRTALGHRRRQATEATRAAAA